MRDLRVVHREAVHVDGHAHRFPALHVPPFEHIGEQTAKRQLFSSNSCSFIKWNIRVVHIAPPQLVAHVQTPGLEHQPPLKQPDGQIAEAEQQHIKSDDFLTTSTYV